jgi:tetrahydromethanopterin S-methyltransferase subunit C
MTVGGGGVPAPSGIDPKKLRIMGLGGATIGIYLAFILNSVTGTNIFSFVGAIAALFGVVVGANAVRRSLRIRHRNRSSINWNARTGMGVVCNPCSAST